MNCEILQAMVTRYNLRIAIFDLSGVGGGPARRSPDLAAVRFVHACNVCGYVAYAELAHGRWCCRGAAIRYSRHFWPNGREQVRLLRAAAAMGTPGLRTARGACARRPPRLLLDELRDTSSNGHTLQLADCDIRLVRGRRRACPTLSRSSCRAIRACL